MTSRIKINPKIFKITLVIAKVPKQLQNGHKIKIKPRNLNGPEYN